MKTQWQVTSATNGNAHESWMLGPLSCGEKNSLSDHRITIGVVAAETDEAKKQVVGVSPIDEIRSSALAECL